MNSVYWSSDFCATLYRRRMAQTLPKFFHILKSATKHLPETNKQKKINQQFEYYSQVFETGILKKEIIDGI